RELIFIVTPHIVRNDEDLRRVGAEEAKKMNWSLREAMDVHGHGYNVLSGQAAQHQNPAMYPTYCPPGANPYGSPMPNYGYGYGYGNTLAPSPNQTLPGGVVPDGIPSQSTPLPYPQSVPGGVLPGGVVPDAPQANVAPPNSSVPTAQYPPTGMPSVFTPSMPAVPVPTPAQYPVPVPPGVNPAAGWAPQPKPNPAPAQQPPAKEGEKWSVFGLGR
ncbi:MAG: hypothetical protein ACRCZF_18005, partial [Gemmataceae bacterium]